MDHYFGYRQEHDCPTGYIRRPTKVVGWSGHSAAKGTEKCSCEAAFRAGQVLVLESVTTVPP